MVLKNNLSDDSKLNLCELLTFHICYGKLMQGVFSLTIIYKVPFSNIVVIKHQQKLVYNLYGYLKQKNNDKRQKLACLWGGIPFPITMINSIMSTLQEIVYRNDSVLFNLHESCFTNINYDLKVCFPTNFSLSKSSGQNLSLLWNIYTCVKICTCNVNT